MSVVGNWGQVADDGFGRRSGSGAHFQNTQICAILTKDLQIFGIMDKTESGQLQPVHPLSCQATWSLGAFLYAKVRLRESLQVSGPLDLVTQLSSGCRSLVRRV